VFLRWIVPIMGEVTVHNGPKPLNGIEMKAIERQLDQVNATFLRDRNALTLGSLWYRALSQDTFVRVSGLDFCEKLNGADAVDGGWFNEGRVKGFHVQSAVNVHAPAPECSRMVCGSKSFRHHVRGSLRCLTVSKTRMGQTRYTKFITLPDRLVGRQVIQ
jgi:hypothetical protein